MKNPSDFASFGSPHPEDLAYEQVLQLPQNKRVRFSLQGPKKDRRAGVYRFMSPEPIAEGGSSFVFQVREIKTNRIAAMKILCCDVTDTKQHRLRWERECEFLKMLNKIKTPNIPKLRDMGLINGFPAIVMKKIKGVPLSEWIADHGTPHHEENKDKAFRITSGACLAVMQDLLETFAHIEQNGWDSFICDFVHGDIKPQNIFIDTSGLRVNPQLNPKVWIIDFGESTLEGEPISGITYENASREQMRNTILGKPNIASKKNDQYQLGRVLKQLLQRCEAEAKAESWLSRTTNLTSDRLAGARKVINRMIAEDDSYRYLDFQEASLAFKKSQQVYWNRMWNQGRGVSIAATVGLTGEGLYGRNVEESES